MKTQRITSTLLFWDEGTAGLLLGAAQDNSREQTRVAMWGVLLERTVDHYPVCEQP